MIEKQMMDVERTAGGVRAGGGVTGVAIVAGVALACCGAVSGAVNEIGVVERFVLADDRAAVLAGLVPGTEDYFYFHALHYEHTGQAQQLDDLLRAWGEERRGSALRERMVRRRALLAYEADPESTIDYLKRTLGLRFDHSKRVPERERELPAELDQALVAPEKFYERATSGRNDLGRLGPQGLAWALGAGRQLSVEERRDLLGRIGRPDLPGVVELVVADLQSENAPGFGGYPVHGQLLLEQLDRVRQAVPALGSNEAFVHAYLAKLRPGADDSLTRDPGARAAFLERAWGFVEPLPPAFNSLKAHLLYHRMLDARAEGRPDRTAFLAYLTLPRQVPYINPVYRRAQNALWNYPVDFGGDFTGVTSLPPVRDETGLVRDYLLHFLAGAASTAPFNEFLSDGFLDPLFAEAKITSGAGEPEAFTKMLSPAAYAALRDRVDIEFAPTNPRTFAPGDEVELAVAVKNVGELLVKVFEINPLNVYLNTGEEVGTDLPLDGLVPNRTETLRYSESPFRRVERKLAFPDLAGRGGVWVIELVGNGISSRALVRKGSLFPVESVTAAGHLFTVVDGGGEVRRDVTAHFGGRSFPAGEDGSVVIPFAQDAGEKEVVFATPDGLAALATFEHQAESYYLAAGFHVERESLLAGSSAQVAVRPVLSVSGAPAPLGALKDVTLEVTFEDRDGHESTRKYENVDVAEGGVVVREFPVPPRAASVSFSLAGKVANLASGEDEGVSASARFPINGVDATTQTGDLHLTWGEGGYALRFLGKSGEPQASRAVELEFRRPGFEVPVPVTLKTGDDGSVRLGELAGVWSVAASANGTEGRTFNLVREETVWPAAVHVRAGAPALVAAPGWLDAPDRSRLSLLEVVDGSFVRDRFGHLGVEGGFVVARDLPPGDYSLALRRGLHGAGDVEVAVRVTAGADSEGQLVSPVRYLEEGDPAPLQVTGLSTGDGKLAFRVANASGATRVHVAASAFVPAGDFHPFDNLAYSAPGLARGVPRFLPSLYLSGRDIGDELRYILERQATEKFAGVLAPRPGLLLNPWELRETDTLEQDIEEAEALRRLVEEEKAESHPAPAAALAATADASAEPALGGDPHNLDFLPGPGLAVYNLELGEGGAASIDLEQFGDRGIVHILVTGAGQSVYRQVAVPGGPEPAFRDLRLAGGLDPDGHFTRQNSTRVVGEGEELQIADTRAAQLQAYATVGDLFTFYSALDESGVLARFGFLPRWSGLPDAEKRRLYSEFACHELHVFLARKDPEFFAAVVAPYLANKRDKTFVDRALLGEDLTRFLAPWEFGRLNAFEQALLAQAIEVARPGTVSRFDDLLELRPAPADLYFEAALAGVMLAGEDSMLRGEFFGFADMEGMDPFSDGSEDTVTRASARGLGRGGAQVEYREQLGLRRKVVAQQLADGLESAAAVDRFAADFDTASFALGEMADRQRGRLAVRDRQVLAKRLAEVAFFRPAGRTREFAENNYYHRPLAEQDQNLVEPSPFWRDFAAHAGGPFVSVHFPAASAHANEMLLALAVSDLPFEDTNPDPAIEGQQLTLAAESPVVVFYRELVAAERDAEALPLLISQSVFRADDATEFRDGVEVEKPVRGGFVAGVVYTSRVVVSNPTGAPRHLTLAAQVPVGSIPVGGTRVTSSVPVHVGAHSTESRTMHFYFPSAGDFGAFPAHVSEGDRLVAFADPLRFDVVDEPTEVDTSSWLHVSQHGTGDDVLEFLRSGNLLAEDLSLAAWRLREDEGFFLQVIAVLEERKVFDGTLYSYAVLHNRKGAIGEYLLHQPGFLDGCGPALASPLVSFDPVGRKTYEHLDYAPLINARAHKLGARRGIPNGALHAQYHRLLDALACKPELGSDDRLALATYLLAQDRVGEALGQFTEIDAAQTHSKLQLAYLGSVLALHRGDTETARAVAEPFAGHPVERWRERFATVVAHAAEAEGGDVDPDDGGGGRQAEQEKLAATEPFLELKAGDGAMQLVYRNTPEVEVNYYEMDLEFLFSTGPFLDGDNERFSFIRPNRSDVLKPDGNADATSFDIPGEYASKNVLVEVRAGGARSAAPHFANRIDVILSPAYGQLQVVADDGERRPVAKAYIKVYARAEDGAINFYKDGYSDLRGRFDYASLTRSGDEMQGVSRFALLVMTEDHGATVIESAPPAQ